MSNVFPCDITNYRWVKSGVPFPEGRFPSPALALVAPLGQDIKQPVNVSSKKQFQRNDSLGCISPLSPLLPQNHFMNLYAVHYVNRCGSIMLLFFVYSNQTNFRFCDKRAWALHCWPGKINKHDQNHHKFVKQMRFWPRSCRFSSFFHFISFSTYFLLQDFL